MIAAYTLQRRFTEALTMLVVSGLSLFLLVYVGIGTARMNYEQIYIEKLVSQGEIVKNTLETFLRSGLPLRQFVGFGSISEPILGSDKSIASIAAYDQTKQQVFAAGDKAIRLVNDDHKIVQQTGGGQLRTNDKHFQLVLPLESKFETIGSLVLTVQRKAIDKRVDQDFTLISQIAASASLAFAVFIFLFGPQLAVRRAPWTAVAFGVTFLTVAGFLVALMVGLYADGVRGKADALANSLGKRLDDILIYNINLGDILGLDRVFTDYKRLNPDIRAAALTIDDKIYVHTDPALVGKRWETAGDTYEYAVVISNKNGSQRVQVTVALPKDVVYRRVVRAVKNFAALFVASGFFAFLFMDLARSLQRASVSRRHAIRGVADENALNLVKPVYFLAVFVENLNAAFLPQFMKETITAEGLPASYTSAPFLAFYLCFALALVPASRFERKIGSRTLIWTGLCISGAGLFALTQDLQFFGIMLARAASGIGQGMLFIGVQSYILAVSSPERRTRGAGIIVFGFQAGMISGMAIGSLLVTSIEPHGVFLLGCAISIIAAGFLVLIVPSVELPERVGAPVSMGNTLREIGSVLTNARFLKTMGFIGIPAKAVMTGVILFALPLILAAHDFKQEDIGQITMIYAACVIGASSYLSRVADMRGNTETILFWGSLICGVGLIVMSLFAWDSLKGVIDGHVMSATVIVGVAIVGIAHGFINAPIITHVSEAEPASVLGASAVASIYRFLERIGHSAGPIVVGQLLAYWNQNAIVLAWIGGAIILFGLLFLTKTSQPRTNTSIAKGVA